MSELIEKLEAQITPRRLKKFRQVIENRTRDLTVLIEAIHKGHNQSAILRTCEAFGLQEVYVVEGENTPFNPHRAISQGLHKWLDIQKFSDTKSAISQLKAKGYQIWASYLHSEAIPLEQIDFTQKIALFFGNELKGISPEYLPLCDGNFIIPMYGFAESFNVSVAVGISLYEATQQRLKRLGKVGTLTPEEKEQLYEQFLKKSVGEKTLQALSKNG